MKVNQRAVLNGFTDTELKGLSLPLQEYVDKQWRTVKTLQADADGVAKFYVSKKRAGTYTFRLYRRAGSGLTAAWSSPVKVKVAAG